MKRYIIMALMLIGSTLWAQNKTTYITEKDYDLIVVEGGWNVVLIQTADYPTLQDQRIFNDTQDTLERIVVYADGEVSASRVFTLKDGILRLKKNTALPQGTTVVIYTAQRLQKIELKPHAVLTTGRIEGYGDLTIAQWERSRLMADTLASNSVLLGFKGDSCYFYCNMIEVNQLLVDQEQGNCYGKIPVAKDDQEQCSRNIYQGQAYRMMTVWDEAPSVGFGRERFSLHLGIGARLMGMGTNNEVFTYSNTAYFEKRQNLSLSIYGKWKMTRRWDFKTGLQFDWYRTPFYSTDDDFFGNSFNNIMNGSAPSIISRYCSQFFLGLPMSLTYHPILHKPEALGLNIALVPSVSLSRMYFVRTSNNGNRGGSDRYSNPFRLEARFGVETNVLGVIHGLQFFVNLLPVYVGVPDANRYREFGLALAF